MPVSRQVFPPFFSFFFFSLLGADKFLIFPASFLFLPLFSDHAYASFYLPSDFLVSRLSPDLVLSFFPFTCPSPEFPSPEDTQVSFRNLPSTSSILFFFFVSLLSLVSFSDSPQPSATMISFLSPFFLFLSPVIELRFRPFYAASPRSAFVRCL